MIRDIRAAILTGAGGTFCAGADLKERGGRAAADTVAAIVEANPAERFSTLPMEKPLLAAIDGYCLAGGLELALI